MSPWNPSYFLFPSLIVCLMSFGMSVGMEKINITWHIYNFSSLPEKNGEFILSNFFYTEDNQIGWRLAFYPRGIHPRDADYISVPLGVYSMDGAKIDWIAHVKWTIEKAFTFVKSAELAIRYDHEFFWGFPQLVERSKLEDLPSLWWWQQPVSIYCEINIPSPRPTIEINLEEPMAKNNFYYEVNGTMSEN